MERVYKVRPQVCVIISLLLLTASYVLVQMVISHVTHSLTLSVDSYHMLYNSFNLLGTLISIKMSNNPSLTKYTFGCYRVEVLGVAMSLVFLLGLLFSTFVTGLQTLVHSSHEDAMHFPLVVLIVGGLGLIINLIAIVFIGGYSHHQTGFLSNKNYGNPRATGKFIHEWPSFHFFFRDTHGSLLVLVCATTVHFTTESLAKFVDPILAILSLMILIATSTECMKGTMSILLQTLPNGIDVAALKKALGDCFPCIENVHDFHLWCLTRGNRVATMHIRFQNPEVYMNCAKDVEQFFRDQHINNVTIQPEFADSATPPESLSRSSTHCLLPCFQKDCESRQCCSECAESSFFERAKDPETPDTSDTVRMRTTKPIKLLISSSDEEGELEELLDKDMKQSHSASNRDSTVSEKWTDQCKDIVTSPQLGETLSDLKESFV